MRLVLRMLLVVATVSLSSVGALAEEGSHYFPGASSSFIDVLPVNLGTSTFAYANESIYYHGSNIHSGVNATTYSDASAFLYQFPRAISFLPGKPQYSVALAVPYTWLQVHTHPVVNSKGAVVFSGRDTDNGFGDVVMFPFMLGWSNIGSECVDKIPRLTYVLQYQTQLGIYAPTGNFDSKSLANVGKNFWTFEPGVALSLLRIPYVGNIPLPFEFTTSAGFDFNTRNSATRYQTGDQFHLDGTLALVMPVDKVGTAVGVGVSGFFYQQITDDSVRGVSVRNFEAMTTGVGPDLSFIRNLSEKLHLAAEVKWLPELSVSNRLQGNAVWFKVAFSWGGLVGPAPCPGAKGFAAQAAAAPPVSAAMRSLYAISSF